MDSFTTGTPGMGFFAMLVIGFLAGWLAEKITQSDHGIITNILVGIAGSFVGGKLAELLNTPVHGFFRTLIAATIGAVLVLWAWRQVRSEPRR
jgi:uncharacterized membrane protein YeaQ/YmgE (transglycosylase-associated protein family)